MLVFEPLWPKLRTQLLMANELLYGIFDPIVFVFGCFFEKKKSYLICYLILIFGHQK